MARSKIKSDVIDPDGSIEKRAVETGFLADNSINHFENYTRDELIKEGYNEAQVEIANRVLAHFDTSVGAKLGRCPPELWQLRPCVDCETTVDQRFNPGRDYGAVLCMVCKLKRDSEHICFKCLGTADDPAEELPLVKKRFIGRDKQGEIQWEYLCTWCALLLGDMEFINKRAPRWEQDEKILSAQLNLTTSREGIYPTIEEAERERREIPQVEYIFFPRHKKDIEDKLFYFKGEDISAKGKNFFIRYTGYVCRIYEEPPPENSLDSYYFLMYHPDDPRKIVTICRAQYFHRECKGYVETFWDPRPRSFNFKNVNTKNREGEMARLQKARPLIFEPERNRGYDLADLSARYPALLTIWQKAKRDSTQAQQDPILQTRWRERVSSSFEVPLPEDLIEWLNISDEEKMTRLHAREDLPFLQEKLRDGFALSKPSEIALEHAARLCRAPPYFYSTAYLFERRRK